jgi:hypothetical protein
MFYRHALIEKRSPSLYCVACGDRPVKEFTRLQDARAYCEKVRATHVDLCDQHGRLIQCWEMFDTHGHPIGG